jgi:hypothetical protein
VLTHRWSQCSTRLGRPEEQCQHYRFHCRLSTTGRGLQNGDGSGHARRTEERDRNRIANLVVPQDHERHLARASEARAAHSGQSRRVFCGARTGRSKVAPPLRLPTSAGKGHGVVEAQTERRNGQTFIPFGCTRRGYAYDPREVVA